MSKNWSKNVDDIYNLHENAIEDSLLQVVRSFEDSVDVSPTNITCIKQVFELLRRR